MPGPVTSAWLVGLYAEPARVKSCNACHQSRLKAHSGGTIVTVVIAQASPQDRGRVAARQIGGAVGGLAGGSGGMWLGCVTGASLEWFTEVAFPAFALAPTEVFVRK